MRRRRWLLTRFVRLFPTSSIADAATKHLSRKRIRGRSVDRKIPPRAFVCGEAWTKELDYLVRASAARPKSAKKPAKRVLERHCFVPNTKGGGKISGSRGTDAGNKRYTKYVVFLQFAMDRFPIQLALSPASQVLDPSESVWAVLQCTGTMPCSPTACIPCSIGSSNTPGRRDLQPSQLQRPGGHQLAFPGRARRGRAASG